MAQEAQLEVLLTLKDQLSGGVTAAEASLTSLASGAAPMASRALSTLEQGASHAWGTITNLASSLGMVGLGGGLLALTGLLKSAIGETESFGTTVLELHTLTGESAESLSGLAAAMEATGLSSEAAQKSIGMASKLIGAMSTQQETDFETKYGISLRDTSIAASDVAAALAVLKDAKASEADQTAAQTLLTDYQNASFKTTNDLILQAADYYNNEAIPAEDKAAALAKEFGRSWQTLIPLFTQGSDGIRELEQTAADMGQTITTENLPAIEAMRDANEKWNESVNALKLQIGLDLLPTLTDLANNASQFVSGHTADIVAWFQGAADTAKTFGGIISGTVVPALQMIIGWWNSIPAPLQELLAGGFLASKLTGIGVSDLSKIVTGGGSSGGGLLGGVQHVWVDNMGLGGLGGAGVATGAGAATGAGEGGVAGMIAGGGAVGLTGLAIAAASILGSAVVVSAAGDLVTAIAGPVQAVAAGTERTLPGSGKQQWSTGQLNVMGQTVWSDTKVTDPKLTQAVAESAHDARNDAQYTKMSLEQVRQAIADAKVGLATSVGGLSTSLDGAVGAWRAGASGIASSVGGMSTSLDSAVQAWRGAPVTIGGFVAGGISDGLKDTRQALMGIGPSIPPAVNDGLKDTKTSLDSAVQAWRSGSSGISGAVGGMSTSLDGAVTAWRNSIPSIRGAVSDGAKDIQVPPATVNVMLGVTVANTISARSVSDSTTYSNSFSATTRAQ